MILLDETNKNQLLTFIPQIQGNYSEWHIVSLRFIAHNKDLAKEIVADFAESYKNTDGFAYIESNRSAVSVIRFGKVTSYSNVQSQVEKKIKGKRCKVTAKKMSASGLKQIQINLMESVDGEQSHKLFLEREEREGNVILVADDDMFIRKTLTSLLSDYAEIHEVDKGDDVLLMYKKINPDVVLLDIHMPNGNGLDIVKSLNEEDSSAFILVSSADAIKNNVLEAMKGGAIGFLAKPVRREKLFAYLDQCITFRKEETCQQKRKY